MSDKQMRAKTVALQQMASLKSEPTALIQYHSQGRVAIIGGMDALEVAPRLNEKLKATMILTEGAEEPGVPTVPVGGRALKLSGHLGAFKISLGSEGTANAEIVTADLVLDLSSQPLLTMALKPPGYIYSSSEEPMLSASITALVELVGTFEKPRYHEYDADLCAHSRSGNVACTRCVDACPADAIHSIAELVEVDANLCQGGGICATVCPSGAMRYSYPRVKDSLEQIRLLLRTYREAGGDAPTLVLVTENDLTLPTLQRDNVLPVVLEEVASVGLEIWLSALAYGAKSILLIEPDHLPDQVAKALNEQLLTTSEILQGLGYSKGLVQMTKPSEQLVSSAVMPAIKPATYSGLGGKRQLAYMAIDHLFEQSPRSRPMVQLTVGAPFGNASVDQDKCTLCMACAGACPGKALQHGQESPRLSFIEANCIQCGTCTRLCPEDAIWITPRLLFDRALRNKVKILQEEQPFCCTTCGKPFATKTMINTMKVKLQGHWMYQDKRALNRITQCEDCRVIDVIQDQEALENTSKGQTLQ